MTHSISDFSMDFFTLRGKVALVTGGGSGLGQGYAVALAKAGADLFVVTHGSHWDETKALIEAAGRRAFFFQANLARKEEIAGVVAACLKAYGRIDILVNNAGMIKRAPLLEYSDQDWRSVLDLNLDAVYYLSRDAAKIMVAQGAGKIINIASMTSFQGGKFIPAYTASKHGVAGLTKAFANELAERNIQVNAIAPGYIETNNTAAIRGDEERNEEILKRIPAGRWGHPSDLMGAVVFLASRASDYLNGHILAVDGGWLAR
jgi:2-deoxy-D-gluconate 3-dehydrogenase